MNLSEQHLNFEYQLLEAATNQGLPIIKALAQSLSNFLFVGMKINLILDHKSYSYHCDFGGGNKSKDLREKNVEELSSKQYLSEFNKLKQRCTKKSNSEESFSLIYDITDDDFVICYCSKKEDALMFSIHAEKYVFNPRIAYDFVADSNVISRLFSLVRALFTQRALGDITFKITQFGQKREHKLSIENLREALKLLRQLTELHPTVEPTDLIEQLLTYVYHASIVDRHRLDIDDNRTEKKTKRIGLVLEFLKTAAHNINNNSDSDPNLIERHFCMLSIIELIYQLHVKDKESKEVCTTPEEAIDLEKAVKTHKTKIFKNIKLYQGGTPHLYQLTELLINSNRIVYLKGKVVNKEEFRSYCNKMQVFLPGIVKSFNNQYLSDLDNISNNEHEAKNSQSTNRLILNRHVLRLMFIYHSFSQKRTDALCQNMTSNEISKLTFSLAYIMQETLRYLRSKEEPFTTRPMHFSSCMLDVIRVHAERIHCIKLPEKLIQRLYAATTQTDIGKQRYQLEKLEHIFTLYIGSFVLGKISLPLFVHPQPDMLTLISNTKLTNEHAKVEKSNADTFKRCLVLTSLFHDVGMDAEFAFSQESYEQALKKLYSNDIIDKIEHQELLETDIQQNFHSIIGGHEVFQQLIIQNSKFKNTSNDRKARIKHYILDMESIVKPTVRAILFHNTSYNISQIGKSEAPLTTYLALLDEIFDWEPSFNYDPQPTKATQSYNDFSVADIRQQQISPELGMVLENVNWREHSFSDFDYVDYLDEKTIECNLNGNVNHTESVQYNGNLPPQSITTHEVGKIKHEYLLRFSTSTSRETPHYESINSDKESGNKPLQKNYYLPRFTSYLGKKRYAIHKMHTLLLKKAQCFGRFKDLPLTIQHGDLKTTTINWQPRMKMHYVGEFFDTDKILDNLDQLMLTTDSNISALVHEFILKMEKQRQESEIKQNHKALEDNDTENLGDPGTVLGNEKNPFANIDIRSCFKELEKKILKKYYDNGIERREFF